LIKNVQFGFKNRNFCVVSCEEKLQICEILGLITKILVDFGLDFFHKILGFLNIIEDRLNFYVIF